MMKKQLILIAIVTLLVGLMFVFLPKFAGDFHDFYMAGRMVMQGHSPYDWPRYYNPIWLAIGFAPLSLVDEGLAYRIFLLCFVFGYSLVMWKCSGGNRLVFMLSFLTPFFIMQFFWGQIDWLVLLGLVVRPEIGLILALTKPQTGIFLAVLLFWQMWKSKGKLYTLIVTAIIVLALILSVVAGMHVPNMQQLNMWNVAVFPVGIPVGLFLIWRAFRRNDRALALAAGPFISVYVALPSWVAVVPAAMKRSAVLVIVIILSWAVALYQFLGALSLLGYFN